MKRILGILVMAVMTYFFVVPITQAQDAGVIHEVGVFELKAYNADGDMIWQEESHNNLADEGEQAFIDVYLRAATGPVQFYYGLSDSSTPCSIADTNTLTTASAGEPSTNGYARQLVERSNVGWPTLALDAGDYQATSKTVTFTASGGSWGPVYCAFVSTTLDNTGKLVSYAPLSTGRTLAAGESLQVTYKVKLQ